MTTIISILSGLLAISVILNIDYTSYIKLQNNQIKELEEESQKYFQWYLDVTDKLIKFKKEDNGTNTNNV